MLTYAVLTYAKLTYEIATGIVRFLYADVCMLTYAKLTYAKLTYEITTGIVRFFSCGQDEAQSSSRTLPQHLGGPGAAEDLLSLQVRAAGVLTYADICSTAASADVC